MPATIRERPSHLANGQRPPLNDMNSSSVKFKTVISLYYPWITRPDSLA